MKLGSSGIYSDGRENHGSGQGKLRHKGAYSPLTARLAQSEFKLFVQQLPLAWQRQGKELILIDVHPSKFRKNLKLPVKFNLHLGSRDQIDNITRLGSDEDEGIDHGEG